MALADTVLGAVSCFREGFDASSQMSRGNRGAGDLASPGMAPGSATDTFGVTPG
jgi:hypothetical protein